jgi:hypothetical protein
MLPRKAKGKRPAFCQDPQVDKLLSMVMALAGEVQVLRERLDTTERMARKKGLYSVEDIEAYVPTPVEELEREKWREEYLSRILWIVDREVDGLRARESQTQTKQDVRWVETE